jgi:hypothetical protein
MHPAAVGNQPFHQPFQSDLLQYTSLGGDVGCHLLDQNLKIAHRSQPLSGLDIFQARYTAPITNNPKAQETVPNRRRV